MKKGSQGLTDNMEAVKGSFLLKPLFKKKKRKELKENAVEQQKKEDKKEENSQQK